MARSFAILRVAKLTTFGEVGASAQHAFRERDTPNADSNRTPRNQSFGVKSSAELRARLDARLAAIDVVDKQAVKCVEYMVTASPEMFKPGSPLHDPARYFNDTVKWLQAKHGTENVLGGVVHLDEESPHLTVYVVPVVQREASTRKRSVHVKGGGRELREFPVPARTELSAKHFFGERAKLRELQSDFASQVAKNHGLQRGIEGSRARHSTPQQYYAALNAEIEASERRVVESRRLAQLAESELKALKDVEEKEKAALGAKLRALRSFQMMDDNTLLTLLVKGTRAVKDQVQEREDKER